MTLVEESYLQSLLNDCQHLLTRQEREAQETVAIKLDQIYQIFKTNIRNTFTTFSHDALIRFAEISVEIDSKFNYAAEFIQLFFQRVQVSSQYYIRGLLVQAKTIAYNGHKANQKGVAMILILKQAINSIIKALDMVGGQQVPKGKESKGGVDPSKAKYSFLVYNASICLYKITRFMLKPNWQRNFTQIYERIYKLFEELDEPDHNWRCRFALIYFQCLYDSDKKPDAFKIIDTLWEKTKNKNCDFQDTLFRLRVHLSKENNALAGVIKKDTEGADPQGWRILENLQKIKSSIIVEAQIEKQLMGVVNQISLGVLSVNQQSTNTTLSPIMQERLAEAGRIALKFNIINIAISITNFLGKVKQPYQKAMILNEYNKAELLIKKKGQFIDKKTGMIMNSNQIKSLQVQYRKQALKILQKVMLMNKKFNYAQLIYEGAVLIWNTSLPFMCAQYQSSITKCFEISCLLLDQIDCIDHDLRTKMHLQLAKIYFNNQSMFGEVEKNIMKAIKLDHSIPMNKISHKYQPQQDPSLYERPYERYLEDFKSKIQLKTLLNFIPNELDQVVIDLWNVLEQKSQNTKIDILQKCLKALLTLEQKPYTPQQTQFLIPQQIANEKILFQRQKIKEYKRKKLLAAQIAELAFEWQLNDYAKKASDFVLLDNWQLKNSVEMIISQSKCCYFMGQIKIDQLVNTNFEVIFKETVRIKQDNQNQVIKEDVKIDVEKKKKQVIKYFEKGLQLAETSQQHWLIFNGATYIWNNFLHIFRNQTNDSKLHPQILRLLKLFFQAMKNSLKEIQNKQIVYYDLDNKIQTFANIGLIYVRLMENQKQLDEASKVCQALLLTSLSPQTRKIINSIKARVNKGNVGSKADPKKGSKDPTQPKSGGYNYAFLYQILSQLEVIQNSTNKADTENLIKKCFQNLETWKPKENDQTQLQLHAQLWCRLARLSLNQQTILMQKYALRCATYSLSLLDPKVQLSSIPSNRLRWYSLAEFLYSEALFKIVNPQTQQIQSCQKLLFNSIEHAVEACLKGLKAGISALVIDAAKQSWNICSKLQSSQVNRVQLMGPIKSVLSYLKQIKDQGESDLILLLSQLYFKAAYESNDFKSGEEVADMIFILLPKNLQKSIWQAKMVFMSKQGKNELQAIANMKEADPTLQAKLWIKLARAATQPAKQQSSYNKAIDILKKENSAEISQVLIQYAEWQLRVGRQKVENVVNNLLLASDYLLDIQCGEEDDEQVEEDHMTVFSRSTRGKKSQFSKSKSIKQSNKQTSKSKKVIDKKLGSVSNKSKPSGNISRMNRSGVVKTIKSKNSKSIFQPKQEDPNPESLNCLHFQRLFRIHTILSIINTNQTDKIKYALDAKTFIIRIYQLSFNSINEIQQNAAKFTEKQPNKQPFKKQILPTSADEWIKLELFKQLMDKVKSGQDYNIMGVYVFDKPQLTYTYLKHLINILQSYGLDFQTIPILLFKKFIAKQILSNELLTSICDLQIAYCLQTIEYKDKPNLNLQKFTPVSRIDQRKEQIKTSSQKLTKKDDNQIFQEYPSINLVKPYTIYDCWLQLGKMLTKFGQINQGKNYLTYALHNYQILGMNEQIGQCYLWLSEIAAKQGQNKQSIEYMVHSNRLCKSSKNFKQLVFLSFKVLMKLKKYTDLKTFLNRVYEVVLQLIDQSRNQRQQKSTFQSQIIQLKNIITSIQIIFVELTFGEIIEENINNNPQPILKDLMKVDERLQSDPLWTLQNFRESLQMVKSIFKHFQVGEQNFSLGSDLFKTTLNLVLKIDDKIGEVLKYSEIGITSQNTCDSINKLKKNCKNIIAEGNALLPKYEKKVLDEDTELLNDFYKYR